MKSLLSYRYGLYSVVLISIGGRRGGERKGGGWRGGGERGWEDYSCLAAVVPLQ